MNRCQHLRALAHARELEKAGIPMDLDLIPECNPGALPPQVLITQEEPGAADVVVPMDNRLVAYMFHVTIVNNLGESLWIFDLDLEPPWEEPRFAWLPDPAQCHPPKTLYRFPESLGFEFSREEVINHRVHGNGLLRPGNFLRGWALGLGWVPLPRRFRQGQLVPMKFSVGDAIGGRFSAEVHLMVDRTFEVGRRQARKVSPHRRTPLFEAPGVAEVETPCDGLEVTAQTVVRRESEVDIVNVVRK